MTESADRYRRLAAGFTSRVAAVPASRWNSPSPCEGWSARDVVGHVIESHGIFLGLVGAQAPPGPSVDDDPIAAWSAARDAVQAGLEDPATAAAAYDGFFGRTTFERSVDQILASDVLIHTWDLARAAGLDDRLDPAEVERVFEAMAGMGEALRSPGVCGPAVDPPPGADRQAELLAFLGRRP